MEEQRAVKIKCIHEEKKLNEQKKMHTCSFVVPICLEEVLALAPITLISIHACQRGFSSTFARAGFLLSSE